MGKEYHTAIHSASPQSANRSAHGRAHGLKKHPIGGRTASGVDVATARVAADPGPEQPTDDNPDTVAGLIEQAKADRLVWMIAQTILEEGKHLLHGRSEVFKTMLALQICEVLANGGEFLLRYIKGGYRVGFVELEGSVKLFAHRLMKFFRGKPPDIAVMDERRRRVILRKKTVKERVQIIGEWAQAKDLDFVTIDSLAKMFPPNSNQNATEDASEVFDELQSRLRTTLVIAHDRKVSSMFAFKAGSAPTGPDEIAGSHRFQADPDIILQMYRPDKRAPAAEFIWDKSREGEKPGPITLYFDKADFRLYPLHPYLHLLSFEKTKTGLELVAEAERRYGWEDRRAREYLATLARVLDAEKEPCVGEGRNGHEKTYSLISVPATLEKADVQFPRP